jgi:hypothetical protein
MTRIRPILLSLLAAFAVSAVVSAPAFAVSPEWFVSGAKLTAKAPPEEKIAEETNEVTTDVLKWNGIEIVCTEKDIIEGFIKNSTENGAKGIIFEGCTVEKPGPGKCAVFSNAVVPVQGKIEVEPLTSTLEGTGLNPKVKFAPVGPVGTAFTTFKIKNISGCPSTVIGTYIVKGTATTGAISAPNTEQTEHVLKFTGTSSNLTIGGLAAEFIAEEGLALATGNNWSIQ